MRIRFLDAIINDAPCNLRHIRQTELCRVAVIHAGDDDSAVGFSTLLPANGHLYGHCSGIFAEAAALCEVFGSDQDGEGICAGLEVDGSDSKGFWSVGGVAVGYNGIET